MEEEKYDLGDSDGMVFEKGRFGKWFENFWYHYKWHTIITLFIVIVVTICTAQICSREKYDVYILYAGSADVRGTKTEGDISAYQTLYKSVSEASEDFDGNGEVTPALETLYMLSDEERLELEAKFKEMKETGEGSYELNYVQLSENNTTFRDRITYSDYYVFLISEPLYKAYQTTDQGSPMFSSLRGLVEEGVTVEFLDDSAVYLHSTEFGKLAGLSDLPEDTLITLRSKSALSSHYNKKSTNEHYENAEKVVRNMLNYGK